MAEFEKRKHRIYPPGKMIKSIKQENETITSSHYKKKHSIMISDTSCL